MTLPHACFGLVIEKGRVAWAAPIAGWTVGQDAGYVISYYRMKAARIVRC